MLATQPWRRLSSLPYRGFPKSAQLGLFTARFENCFGDWEVGDPAGWETCATNEREVLPRLRVFYGQIANGRCYFFGTQPCPKQSYWPKTTLRTPRISSKFFPTREF